MVKRREAAVVKDDLRLTRAYLRCYGYLYKHIDHEAKCMANFRFPDTQLAQLHVDFAHNKLSYDKCEVVSEPSAQQRHRAMKLAWGLTYVDFGKTMSITGEPSAMANTHR